MIAKDIELQIQMHFEHFLDNKITSIMNLSISDLDINIFLVASVRNQLRIKTSYDLSEWLVRQRLERSMVTSLGSTLQNIAKEFSNEKPLPNLTARIIRDQKIYNLIIKSGSNHNVQVTRDIQRILLQTKNKEPDSIPIFGICYGQESMISSIVKKYTNGIHVLIGNDFWSFISEDPNCYKRILKIASEVDQNYRDPNVGFLSDVIEQKIKYVDQELQKMYGNNNNFWKGILGII